MSEALDFRGERIGLLPCKMCGGPHSGDFCEACDDDGLGHLRAQHLPFTHECSKCGRNGWAGTVTGLFCGLPQPDGKRCVGTFQPRNLRRAMVAILAHAERSLGASHAEQDRHLQMIALLAKKALE